MEKINDKDCECGSQVDCCCNCKCQVLICKHPMNKVEFANGSILDSFGYGCDVRYGDEPDDEKPAIIFSDSKHGLCELHIRNENK